MRKQVIVYAKQAKDLKEGEQILSNRHTIVEVAWIEPFKDTRSRPCIEVNILPNGIDDHSILIFGEKDFVLTVE